MTQNADSPEIDLNSSFIQNSLDSMSQGISVTQLIDGELMVVLCNSQFIELLDFPNEFKSMPRRFSDFIRYNAERGEYGEGDVEQQIAQRVNLACEFRPHELIRTRPNGSIIELIGKPLNTGHGFVTTYTDVTKKDKAQTYSNLLIQALDRIGAGIAIFDPYDSLALANETIMATNPFVTGSPMPGFGYDDWGQAMIDTGLIEDIANRKQEWLYDWQKNRDSKSGPLQIHRTDGLWQLIDVVNLQQGHTVMVINDITELEKIQSALVRAKEEAELANRTKTDFLANMSHELRTPLNSVIGFSELLMATDLDTMENDKINEYLSDINHSGRHLLRLISDILDISKIEVGELQIDEEALCLRELSDECVRMISGRAKRAGTIITNNDRPPMVRLLADERRIKQIVLNLLTNAIKFTGKGGNITLGWLLNDDESLTLQVKDTGTGMTPENIQVALEPFGQVANSMTRDHEGTGLGLPLSRRLAVLHQGKLEIESAVNVGTQVNVTFPKERVITDFDTDDTSGAS